MKEEYECLCWRIGRVRLLRLVKNSTPLIIEDFFPSILEMADVDSAELPQTLDGMSFVSLLEDHNNKVEERPLYWHYPNAWGPFRTRNRELQCRA